MLSCGHILPTLPDGEVTGVLADSYFINIRLLLLMRVWLLI